MDTEHKNPGPEKLDRWLDATLRAGTDAEPRMGLEDRVLARLATERPRSTFSWMPLLAAVAVVVAVSVALIVTYSSRRSGLITAAAPPNTRTAPISDVPRVQAAGTAPEMSDSSKTNVRRIARSRAPEIPRAVDHEQALPRLATFPAPSPETAQERLLARIAARRSSFEVAITSLDLVPLRDLSVPELTIEPMEGTPPDNIPQ